MNLVSQDAISQFGELMPIILRAEKLFFYVFGDIFRGEQTTHIALYQIVYELFQCLITLKNVLLQAKETVNVWQICGIILVLVTPE